MTFHASRVRAATPKSAVVWRLMAWILIPIITSTQSRADAARDCGQLDDLNRTIRGCTEYIARDSHSAGAYNNRGVAYHGKGDHDRAIADYTKAVTLEERPQTAACPARHRIVRQV
jgi:tetratricopeptide (TPR) repeat protein